jgi:GNAT superfamily N-acetyltransferase
MGPVIVTALTEPTAGQLAGVAEVFDQYRRHYGQPVVAGQTLAWLSDHTSHRRLTVFAAHIGEDLAGLATTVILPASLRLGCSWQLRDLYVVPGARHRGVARALVGAVCQAATAAGAIRLSVQDRTQQHRGAPALPHKRLRPGRGHPNPGVAPLAPACVNRG